MLNRSNLKTLKSTLMAGAAIATVAGMAHDARAQDAVEKVTVTGSRIPQKGLTSVSPVTTISNAEVKLQGATSAETVLNNLPQVFANQGSEVSNGSSGTATVDLRFLGPKRTLVLVNGRRLAPADADLPVTDLNQIPIALIERVEVLTGGASAVYGADAVAGVVNFIMRKNFEGVEFGAQYGITDHENDNSYYQSILQTAIDGNPDEYAMPDRHVNDGRTISAWGVMGANSADNKGNVTLYAQHRHAQPILQSERDWSACSTSTNTAKTAHSCFGSINSQPGLFADVGAGYQTGFFTSDDSGEAVESSFARFNFAPTNYLQRPDNRYLLGAMGRYEIAPDAELYSELSFTDDHTLAQIAPSGLFFQSGAAPGGHQLVNCDNPFLAVGNVGDRWLDAFCGGVASSTNVTLDIARRMVEGGPRIDDLRHTTYRGVMGIKGQFDDIGWDYDVSAQYGTNIFTENYQNDMSLSKIGKALQVVNTGPDGILLDDVGTPLVDESADNAPICTSVLNGSDPNCIPLNIWQLGALTPEAINYISTSLFKQGETTETVVNASFTGEVLTLPWAATAIGAAIGGEYRQETTSIKKDPGYLTGDGAGQGGPQPNVAGHYDVWEAFGEVQIPIVEDRPWAKLVEISAGYRISDYSSVGITHTYKYAGAWAPVDDLRFRGSFQRAVRAPNIVELFLPSYFGLWGGNDPCAVTTPSLPAPPPSFDETQCERTGLSPAQYAITSSTYGFACPAAQCASNFTGNSALKPESSDTKSFGLVFTPTFLKGFNAQVDYYDILVDDIIGIIPQSTVLSGCANSVVGSPEDLFFCPRIHRAPGTGVLSGAGYIFSPIENLGYVQTTGIDVNVGYRTTLDAIGMDDNDLSLNFVGTSVLTWDTKNTLLPSDTVYDCTGLYGTTCGNPTPEWRHSFRATWGTGWDVNLSLNWRHVSEVTLDRNEADPQLNGGSFDTINGKIPAYNYLDVAFDWTVSDHVALRGGIINLTDEDPPIVDSNTFGISSPPFGNANTFPVVYDSLGREVFVSMTTRF
jgi:iron complex outermembrane recepter protein